LDQQNSKAKDHIEKPDSHYWFLHHILVFDK
jgi:hypothetical protein